jgi:hypothetical protein
MTMRWYAQCTEAAVKAPCALHARRRAEGAQMHRKLFAALAVSVAILAALAKPAVSVTTYGRRTVSGAWML